MKKVNYLYFTLSLFEQISIVVQINRNARTVWIKALIVQIMLNSTFCDISLGTYFSFLDPSFKEQYTSE
jgi:hypothetical protein